MIARHSVNQIKKASAALNPARFLPFVLLVASFVIAPSLHSQVVSSGISGIVRSSDGSPVEGALVTAVHEPTNSVQTATTPSNGRFSLRNLRVGGPYTVTVVAEGYQRTEQGNINTNLGSDTEVLFRLEGQVIDLDVFTVKGEANPLDFTTAGTASVISSERLVTKPTSERSLADMISATPLVTLRSTFGDREESQITAVGQNNRYNSILIDGARINDQFGLNGTGLASFFNPLSLDTIEQLSVAVSPYDVRLAGFTGAAINAVTKSGTNEFRGSAYYYYRGDEILGLRGQGENPREKELTRRNVTPKLDRKTWGMTLGGPILRDKLFFFVAYEDFESVSAGRDPLFAPANERQLLDRLNQISTAAGKSIDWGSEVTEATTNTAVDEKIIAKIDWNINSDHRFAVRYTKTDGEVPQFGNFASSSASLNGVRGGITHTPDGHFYSQQRTEESWAGQLFSEWTPEFKTEIKYSQTTQDQTTPINTVAPMILITGVSGQNLSTGANVTNGSYIVGTEQFRHGNLINVDSKQFNATGSYFWNDFVFTFGYEREQSDFLNVFRQQSYGLVAYQNLDDFLNDTNAVVFRNYYDPAIRPVADLSDFATNGLFAGVQWNASHRLTLNGGLRYEFAEMGSTPTFNQALFNDTGFRNDGTLDGSSAISPRIGFNYALDDERSMQIRGGAGHFVGRAPWVFFSNSFNSLGVGDFSRRSTDPVSPLPSSLTEYLRDHFDPANPSGTGTDSPGLRRGVNWFDDGLSLPQVWRTNLAFEKRLAFLQSVATAEVVYTKIDQALFIRNDNLRESGAAAADGRLRFAGNPGTAANAKYEGFTDLYHVVNVDAGDSTYITLSWDRPLIEGWGFNLAYTRGSSTEAQAVGQTTASGQWQRNVVFNQGKVENGRSDFEIKDRFQATFITEFAIFERFPTTVSLYYEGRSGNPYSWVYSSDLNGDGRSDNDRVAVPTDGSDSRFDFSGMSSAQLENYLAFMKSSGLSNWAGGIAPKNSHREPFVHRLDLKFSQDVLIYESVKMSLFLDFINFGAFLSRDIFGNVEISPLLSNDVFRRRYVGGASYTAEGKIKPTFTANPANFNIDNGMSRWRIQVGAKVSF